MDLFNKKKLKEVTSDLEKCRSEKHKCDSERQALLSKYSKIIDLKKEVETVTNELQVLRTNMETLETRYEKGRKLYNELVSETELYENRLELMSYGHYEPIFDFETADSYKEEIYKVKALQKEMISNKTAITCYTQWYVEGSASKGTAMTNRQMKLMLRAFNNECDALISKVKWNNILNIKVRILKSINSINALGKSNQILINEEYWHLKEKELELTHEYSLKKYEEKEAQREERARIREEEKAQRDYNIAKRKAEKEEAMYQKALEKAKHDLGLVDGEELVKLQSQISDLETNLSIARHQKERALSMAQQTKSGYVYVISNIGSFGENMYKIGLTRRLEPLDRVKELGDSSVPFKFDVHALIFSTNAPALEYQLHQVFKERSVNLINFRKEFFKVSLDEIEKEVNKILDKNIEFVRTSEAKEFKESVSIRQAQVEQNEAAKKSNKFPKHLFEQR
ncbi:DUF4041 domain-containing protein [uncultured Zobellia sp.]|uniref:DUF4041 domain-containing protein n=1 Tax=uncultured Zobellia sp. TaxID=255433 RepID=UPI002594E24D|nr:DUF4041 domain-containing protein [uncultured Zobellia sp.]